MKILIKISAFFLIAVFVFISCNKDKPVVTPPVVNLPPTARAGADLSFTMRSCGDFFRAALNGGESTDPNNNIISYTWKLISGPVVSIRLSTSVTAIVEYMRPGEYAFELSVKDAGNLVSTDTMLISVKGTPTFKEYDLDITFNANFTFLDNNKFYCDDFDNCYFYDLSLLNGIATFLPIGEFKLDFREYADTATLSYETSTSDISIYRTNPIYRISGTPFFNLKKLFQQGGGPFNGTFIVRDGSAHSCDPDVFKNRSPLNISGSLDTAAKKATVRIYGKTYF